MNSRIETLFHKALNVEPSQRAEFLRQASEGDEALRQEAENLLRAYDDAQGFMEKPAYQTGSEYNSDGMAEMPLPESVGRYRIHSVIATGGMGVVYRGEQESPRRVVAVKVLKGDCMLPELMQRFQREAEILGRLHHPGIAQIFEAGKFESGGGLQPFFAMEFIQGSNIVEYAARRNFGVAAKLRLLIRVSQAVHHAHQMGVIHRDIKPGNILVDMTGQPKVLDFGVARVALSKAGGAKTMTGQMIGTLDYMSPEQIAGTGEVLDARSDVYALGVLGFELLTGDLPYDLVGKTIAQSARIIGEENPRSLASYGRNFHGDLDAIFATALEKEKERRYASASAFAADLERYLSDEPVHAKLPSTMHQVRRFARRNKALVGGVFGIVLALTAGLFATLWQMRRAQRSELQSKEYAERERQLRLEADRDRNRALVAAAFARAKMSQIREWMVRQGPGRGKGAVLDREEMSKLALAMGFYGAVVDAIDALPQKGAQETRRTLAEITKKAEKELGDTFLAIRDIRNVIDLAYSTVTLSEAADPATYDRDSNGSK